MRFVFALAVFWLIPTTANAADPVKGAAAFAVCTTCHGATGEGNVAMNAPLIGGQEVWYLERQIKAFKAGHRGANPQDAFGATMAPMAATLADDAAIADVAAYVATLKPPAPAVTTTGDAAKGAIGYAVCAACHGPDARGLEATGAPALVNQSDWYILRQLANFRGGLRGTHPSDTFGAMMAPMAATVDEAQAKDIVAYLKTLRH